MPRTKAKDFFPVEKEFDKEVWKGLRSDEKNKALMIACRAWIDRDQKVWPEMTSFLRMDSPNEDNPYSFAIPRVTFEEGLKRLQTLMIENNGRIEGLPQITGFKKGAKGVSIEHKKEIRNIAKEMKMVGLLAGVGEFIFLEYSVYVLEWHEASTITTLQKNKGSCWKGLRVSDQATTEGYERPQGS